MAFRNQSTLYWSSTLYWKVIGVVMWSLSFPRFCWLLKSYLWGCAWTWSWTASKELAQKRVVSYCWQLSGNVGCARPLLLHSQSSLDYFWIRLGIQVVLSILDSNGSERKHQQIIYNVDRFHCTCMNHTTLNNACI